MPAAMDPDERNFTRAYFLKGFTVADRDEPILCAMYDVGMAFNPGDPFIGPQVVTQHNANGQDRKEAFDHP